MPIKLSKAQRDVLGQIGSEGRIARPIGGGYWQNTDGTIIYGANTTHTIQALARRGFLAPAAGRSGWHPTYVRTGVEVPS